MNKKKIKKKIKKTLNLKNQILKGFITNTSQKD